VERLEKGLNFIGMHVLYRLVAPLRSSLIDNTRRDTLGKVASKLPPGNPKCQYWLLVAETQ